MKETFIVCCYCSFTKDTKNVHVTDDKKNAFYTAITEKQDNKYDTFWIEVWNKSGMIVKFEEKDFMDENTESRTWHEED